MRTVGLVLVALATGAVDGQSNYSLTVRNAHGMAFDSRRGVTVLFGGADAESVRGDTWEWDGAQWKAASDSGPEPRTFPAMTFDSVRGVTLVFGGNRVLFGATPSDSRFLDDFWSWNGKRWRRLPASPGPRAEAALAFDEARGRAILFGGYRRSGDKTERLGDTWEWDGEKWIRAATTGPSPRNGAALAYDTRRARTVLFGGPPVTGGGFETWEWDGASWQKGPSVTEGRFNSVMVYEEAAERMLRFGGWNGKQRRGDTWEYDGSSWKRLAQTGPAARNHAAMVYDSRRKRAVLFGGHDGENVFGDLWEWDGERWLQRIATAPRKRIDNGH